MAHNQDLGQAGEELIVNDLRTRGWTILDRNFRCRQGEIDIVALDGQTIVCLEVKTRRSHDFGHPAQAITAVKLRRMRQLCALWMTQHDVVALEIRLDVAAVTWPLGETPVIEYLQAVTA